MKYNIYKPTHKFFAAPGELAIAIGQLRGDSLYLNRLDSACNVVETAKAIGSCTEHLTNYGKGVAITDTRAIESMRGAWRYMFGDVPGPVFCELHRESDS